MEESNAYDEVTSPHIESFCHALQVEQNASVHTIRAYHTDLKDFIRWAYREKLDPLTMGHRDLRLYLGELDQAHYSRTTINRRLSTLKSFYRWLTITGVTESDPAGILQGPKQNKGLPHTIQPKDMAKLLSVYGPYDTHGKLREQSPVEVRNQAILEFLYACGARVSEVSGLELMQTDFERGQVKVFGKGQKERIIPLHDIALYSMKKYHDISRPKLLKEKNNPYFFLSIRGNQMTTDALRKMFKDALRLAGIDETLSPHDMRHTFATDMLAGGADLRSVQEMLGHASLSTTQIYTHLSTERLKKAHTQAHPRA